MYYNEKETAKRIEAVKGILKEKNLDAALIYFDELNVANGWYLTGWCGQFEKGAVLVPVNGEPYLLGGPESEIFFSGVICSIEEYCQERGYQIFLCNSHENAEKEMACVNQLYSYRVSGIIIATVRDSIPDDDLLIRGNIPVVFFDNAPTTTSPVSTVCTDNYSAGKYAAELLIKNNHTKIATIMGKQTESGARDRYKGFSDAFKENGLSDAFDAKFCDFKEESAYKAAMELLSENKYTGYFITSSKMLYGCLKAFRESGIKIPEDVSVVGFDVEDAYNTMHYSVTSILQSEREMGEFCAKLLLSRIQKNAECENIQIPFGVTNKNSVRKI